MAAQRLWLLNFDADLELARPVGYTPPAAVLLRSRELAERAVGLVPPEDRVLDESAPRAGSGQELEGRAFCPTPRALRVLAGAGARLPGAPSLDVLRRVNHRAFSAELGQCLDDARFVRDRDALLETLAARGGPWVLKRAFGFAGRGRQRLRANVLDVSVEPFVRASFESGEGLQVEPWVERTLDVALHGFVSPAGAFTIGEPTTQRVDDGGAWIASAVVSPGTLDVLEKQTLFEEGERVASALCRAGYFGPFGIDAYRWIDERRAARFNARSEINARYTMGWAIGMGASRPDLALALSSGR